MSILAPVQFPLAIAVIRRPITIGAIADKVADELSTGSYESTIEAWSQYMHVCLDVPAPLFTDNNEDFQKVSW